MKHIIIAGPSRAGKSTLSKLLGAELNCFVISADKLVSVLDGAYPQLDIRLNWNRDKTTHNLSKFFAHFMGAFASNQGIVRGLNLGAHAVDTNRFALEGGYFDFDIIVPILATYGIGALKDSFTLIGLTQDGKTAAEYFVDFRKYDTPDDWTYALSDDELFKVCEDAVSFSRLMTSHLVKHGFSIYNTSKNRESVFERIISDIKSEAFESRHA